MHVRGLESVWKQGHLDNDLKSLDLDMTTINETRISRKHPLAFLFEDYDVFSFCGLSGASGSVAVLLRKSLDFQVRLIFLDPNGWVVVMDVNDSKSVTFRLVVVNDSTESKRPDFFERLQTFLRTSRTSQTAGD